MPAHILIAGTGFAGLAAARELEDRGFRTTVIDARDRVGGRVHTLRDFAHGQHAEAGADIIDPGHDALKTLARRMDLTLVPILRRGFGYYGTDPHGRLRRQSLESGFRAIYRDLAPLIRDYRLSEKRWDSPIAQQLGSTSLATWVREVTRRTDPAHAGYLLSRLRGLRGLFLADPEDLSLLALVDFMAEDPFEDSREATRPRADKAARSRIDDGPTRIAGGNDRLATALASSLKTRPRLRTVLQGIRQRDGGVDAFVDSPRGPATISADYVIITLPPGPLRDVQFDPPLPDLQRDAIDHLHLGPATRVVLQFKERFWTRRIRPSLFGSDQPTGAVWDGNEQQRGPAGILSLLAGGGASRDLRAIIERDGMDAVVHRLRWLGAPASLLESRVVTWETDPWAQGGYAVFDHHFDPRLRQWFARPSGRVLFAGEHTSIQWQGYMNGAVESGQRAAAEIFAILQTASLRA